MRLSVVIPCRDAERTLERTIDSLFEFLYVQRALLGPDGKA